MHLEKISLRALIVISLLTLAAASVAHTMLAKLAFRDATIDFHVDSLSRVIEVAASESVRQMRGQALDLCHTLQGGIVTGLGQTTDDDQTAMQAVLDDPFINGFRGAGELYLVKLRVYDAGLRLLAQSSQGLEGLPEELPPFLRSLAVGRTGVDRFKALGGLWQSPQGPLYSVLTPLGGFRILGYLEAVVEPAFNLAGVGSMIQMPFRIYTAEGRLLGLNREDSAAIPAAYLPVEYLVRSEGGEPALRLVAYENPQSLYRDLDDSQLRISSGFLVTMVIGFMLFLWLLNRLLFRPMDAMITRMESCTDGDIDIMLDETGIEEIRRTAGAFNILASRVRDSLRVLQQLSAVDGLTGIANRRHFDMQLEREWQRAQRNGTTLALVLMDIDYFKQYNDSKGHLAGDQCLRQISAVLRNVTRSPTDLVARYGGEEFVALLPETYAAGAAALAQRIMGRVADLHIAHPASGAAGCVTLSIGVAAMRVEAGTDSAVLVAAADAALYRAKSLGRDRVEIAPPASAPES